MRCMTSLNLVLNALKHTDFDHRPKKQRPDSRGLRLESFMYCSESVLERIMFHFQETPEGREMRLMEELREIDKKLEGRG